MLTGALDAKERIRQATDIVELVGAAHDLRRQGRNYVTICPWHEDSRPSLQINPERQTWKCWVCDIGGDVFSYMMRAEGVDFREAMQMLAERAGIEISTVPQAKVEPGSPDDKKTLLAAVDWAVTQYHDCLLNNSNAEPARNYLSDRTINEESIHRYTIGYAPNEWQWILDRAKSTSYSPQVLEAAGLVIKSDRSTRYYDRYRGRVLFPIRDPQKRAIGIGGRILPQFSEEKSAKYINSPETRLYTKSDQLYGLDVARDGTLLKQDGIVVMEGYTDVVMSRQYGVDNTVAVCGTSLTENHIRLIRRFTDRITLVLDGDDAGDKAANRVLEMFIASEVDIRVVTLPDGLDPCDFLLQKGTEAFQQFLKRAPDALEHKIQTTTKNFDPMRDTHQANQALHDLLTTIAKAPRLQDGGSVQTRLREQQVLNRLSREFRIDEAELRSQLGQLRRNARSKMPFVASEPTQKRKPTLAMCEKDLFELLLRQPDAIPSVLERVALSALRTDAARLLYEKYADLEAEGVHADLNRLLVEFDDVEMKSLLVGLDENAHRKSTSNFELVLRDVVAKFTHDQTEHEIRGDKAALSAISHEDGVRKLQEILRKRCEVNEQ